MTFFTRFPLRKDGRAGRDADGDGILNEGKDAAARGEESESRASVLSSLGKLSSREVRESDGAAAQLDHADTVYDYLKWSPAGIIPEPELDKLMELTDAMRDLSGDIEDDERTIRHAGKDAEDAELDLEDHLNQFNNAQRRFASGAKKFLMT